MDCLDCLVLPMHMPNNIIQLVVARVLTTDYNRNSARTYLHTVQENANYFKAACSHNTYYITVEFV